MLRETRSNGNNAIRQDVQDMKCVVSAQVDVLHIRTSKQGLAML